MFKFLRAFILSIIVFVAIAFSVTTYIGYRYLPEFAQRVSPKNLKPAAKKKPVATPTPQPVEAPIDADEALLMKELDKEEPTAISDEPEKSSAEVVAELDYLDHVVEVQQSMTLPSLCKIICDRPRFSSPAGDDVVVSIKKYFEKEQNRAFEDPAFRVALLRTQLIADIFPKPLRQLMLEVDQFDSFSETDKVLWVARGEIEMSKFVFNLYNTKSEGHRNEKVLDEMLKLKKGCSKKAAPEIENSCQNINIANW